MAHPLVAKLYRSLLTRTAVLSFAVLIVLGVATGALPMQCFAGASCDADPALAAADDAGTNLATNSLPAAGLDTTAQPAAVEVASLSQPAAPSLTDNDLIASTFAMLDVTMKPPANVSNLGTPKAEAHGGPPTTRVVSTTVIRNSLPLAPEAAQQVATAVPPSTLPSQSPAVEAVASIDPVSSEPAVEMAYAAPVEVAKETPSEPETATAVEAAPPGEATATTSSASTGVIKGKGANVRSLPAKGGSEVLFALNGGARVTIGENSKGWLKITDEKGRSGWIYKDYVTQ